jgi:16S rRNA (uracil1498-N3)-methyltransferase
MTRRRWIADEVSGNRAALTGEHALHLSRVLRAHVGQEFDISVGNAVRRGTITSISNERIEFDLGAGETAKPAPGITLVLSIFKFDRMEWAIEKCTEIGVARIIPLVARRTDAHLAAAAVKRRERWQRIARQAAEQSRRTVPTEIAAPIKFAQLATLRDASGMSALSNDLNLSPELRVVLAETEANIMLRDVVETQHAASFPRQREGPTPGAPPRLILAIGPEGGWTEDEVRWFRESGWSSVSLGETILRAETAAIVASAIALDCLR